MTYKSRGRATLVDYSLYRQSYLKEMGECKEVTGDNVARQHQMFACRTVLVERKRDRVTAPLWQAGRRAREYDL